MKELAITETERLFRLIFGASLLPRATELQIDYRIFVIALSLASVTTLVFGLLPALQLSRVNHLAAMGTRASASGAQESRTRSVLVVGELFMATLLLVGAGLLANSFVKLMRTDLGYTTSNALEFQTLLPDTYSNARKAEAVAALLERLRAIPGVMGAGFSRHGVLITEELFIGNLVPQGKGLEEMRREPMSRVRLVSAGFITALEMPVVRGREFTEADGATAPFVIVLNQSAARKSSATTKPPSGRRLIGTWLRPACPCRSWVSSPTSGTNRRFGSESRKFHRLPPDDSRVCARCRAGGPDQRGRDRMAIVRDSDRRRSPAICAAGP